MMILKRTCIKNDEMAVSPVIAVILLVAITVVLTAVLYVMVSGMMDESSQTTPTIGFRFAETSQENFTGGVIALSREVMLEDVSITIISADGNDSLAQEIITGDFEISLGTGKFTAEFRDIGLPGQLDSTDVFILSNAHEGSIMRLVYKPSGGLLGVYNVPAI